MIYEAKHFIGMQMHNNVRKKVKIIWLQNKLKNTSTKAKKNYYLKEMLFYLYF